MTAQPCAWNVTSPFRLWLKPKSTTEKSTPLIPMTRGSPVSYVIKALQWSVTWPIIFAPFMDWLRACWKRPMCPIPNFRSWWWRRRGHRSDRRWHKIPMLEMFNDLRSHEQCQKALSKHTYAHRDCHLPVLQTRLEKYRQSQWTY